RFAQDRPCRRTSLCSWFDKLTTSVKASTPQSTDGIEEGLVRLLSRLPPCPPCPPWWRFSLRERLSVLARLAAPLRPDVDLDRLPIPDRAAVQHRRPVAPHLGGGYG